MNQFDSKHSILINHIGYDASGIKKTVFQTTSEHLPERFNVIDSKNDVIYEGEF